MAIHSSILAWRIPWTEEPDRLQSTGSQELDTAEQLNHDHHHKCKSNMCCQVLRELSAQHAAAAAAKSLQSCPTLCNPRDGSPPVPVILQARTLEWVAISFSNA